jgi:hypothetical protein
MCTKECAKKIVLLTVKFRCCVRYRVMSERTLSRGSRPQQTFALYTLQHIAVLYNTTLAAHASAVQRILYITSRYY